MTLKNEAAIANAGAVIVEGFALMTQVMIGIVVLMSLCAQRYDKDEHLNISFASDMRRLSTAKMTDNQFNTKLIRYARYSLTFQWLSYFICHILILTHEFVTEPDIVDHFIYITFLISLSCLFLTFRNIGIYFFFPFTDDKNFANPAIKQQKRELLTDLLEHEDENKIYDEDGNFEEKDPSISGVHHDHDQDHDHGIEDIDSQDQDQDQDQSDSNNVINGVNSGRYSHHHYADPDLMPDVNMAKITGDEDWDNYNKERLQIRINLVHLFRCMAYTSIIYWIGYVIAAIHGKNDVVLATLALADILFGILVCGHMYYMKQLIDLLNKYETILSYDDMEYTKRRQDRLFYLNRWFRADIGILIVLTVKCIVLLVRISTEKSSFSWPASHPIFLATTLVIIASCQMTCCRYIWVTKTD